MDKNLVEISVYVIRETDKALLINDGDDEAWIPKSLVEDLRDDYEIGNVYTIEIPEWIATEKGLI